LRWCLPAQLPDNGVNTELADKGCPRLLVWVGEVTTLPTSGRRVCSWRNLPGSLHAQTSVPVVVILHPPLPLFACISSPLGHAHHTTTEPACKVKPLLTAEPILLHVHAAIAYVLSIAEPSGICDWIWRRWWRRCKHPSLDSSSGYSCSGHCA
jgi:hypothetical protein